MVVRIFDALEVISKIRASGDWNMFEITIVHCSLKNETDSFLRKLFQSIQKGKVKCVTFWCHFITYNCFLSSICRFGDVSLQESINQENFELLQEYYKIFMEKMPPDCKYVS